jgi:hypothetical protein
MPVDNEHGGVAEPIRRFMAGMLPRKKRKITPTEGSFLNGRNVLIDYYVYRVLKFPLFGTQYLRTCLKAEEAWVRALISVGLL